MRCLLLVLLALTVLPAQAQFAGEYAVTGTNLDGSPYEGTLAVTQRGPVHFFAWATGNDFTGASIHDGNVAAVGFSADNGYGCGVVMYRVDGTTLNGTWASAGSEQFGAEQAQRTSGGNGLAGSYAVSGRNHNTTEYSDTLTLEAIGSLYRLVWGGGYEGVGLPVGDHLAVVYGPRECGVVAYRSAPDGTLSGTWAMNDGSAAVGTERAVRR